MLAKAAAQRRTSTSSVGGRRWEATTKRGGSGYEAGELPFRGISEGVRRIDVEGATEVDSSTFIGASSSMAATAAGLMGGSNTFQNSRREEKSEVALDPGALGDLDGLPRTMASPDLTPGMGSALQNILRSAQALPPSRQSASPSPKTPRTPLMGLSRSPGSPVPPLRLTALPAPPPFAADVFLEAACGVTAAMTPSNSTPRRPGTGFPSP
eukprot:TRINITY_DN24273_c0_g3_i1.p1 TRINITY_DN24273_c0_g3~~TRINITY_DN24273_c0_g3_i1.p1  ORF type:complete len:246 (-),score=54.66 TRINITY_DN24273_c0_g3_i1:66-698(-)